MMAAAALSAREHDSVTRAPDVRTGSNVMHTIGETMTGCR